jgi:hypothetical protein
MRPCCNRRDQICRIVIDGLHKADGWPFARRVLARIIDGEPEGIAKLGFRCRVGRYNVFFRPSDGKQNRFERPVGPGLDDRIGLVDVEQYRGRRIDPVPRVENVTDLVA